MKIAYLTPLNPVRSGISDFAEQLLPYLSKQIPLEIFSPVEPEDKTLCQTAPCHLLSELESDAVCDGYDALLCQIGNHYGHHSGIVKQFQKRSGFLELHDFSLHNYVAQMTYARGDVEGYRAMAEYNHGTDGLELADRFLSGEAKAPWEEHALEMTMNRFLVDYAKGVIVHSDMAKQMIKGINPKMPVINIPLHTPYITKDAAKEKKDAREVLHLSETTMVFGSFGFATRAKRIEQILEALALYRNENQDFHYYIVGKVEGLDMDEILGRLQLENYVTVTGFVDMEEFQTYMAACDLCLNLRYPTHGESSASLHQMLGLGKPVLVTAIGSFDEYSDDFVIKISHDEDEIQEILQVLCKFTEQRELLDVCGEKALEFAHTNCDIEINAERYAEFMRRVLSGTWQDDDPVDLLLDQLIEIDAAGEQMFCHLEQIGVLNAAVGQKKETL